MTYTNEQVLEAARAVVEERGADYVYRTESYYDGCRYSTDEGAPSCLVGYVVHRLDLEGFKSLFDYEVEHEGDSQSAIDALRGPGVKGFTYDQVAALQDGQEVQDSGDPWGQALEAIEERLGVVQ